MNQNKKIAEFMGMTPHHLDSGCMIRVDDNGSNEVVPIDELKYDTSWDWLMPVVQKCFEGAHEDDFFKFSKVKAIEDCLISGSLPNMEATYKAVVEFIEGFSIESVEPDTKAIDEAFFEGFCLALEYAKTAIESADDIEIEFDECAGDLNVSGTISVEISEHLDTDNMVEDIMSKYERDTEKS
jgi:hypothetical protein